jgi:serine protease Do
MDPRSKHALTAATILAIGIGVGHAAPRLTSDGKPLPPPSPTQIADARQLGHTFAAVASQIGPSVVRISVTKVLRASEEDPLEKFFYGDGARERRREGVGSGVVIDAQGHILTNAHVVSNAEQVKVAFIGGKTVKGRVVGVDPTSDLAVIKVSGVDVKPATLGDSDKVEVGDFVIAVGNPFGLDHTVTVGVLSAKNRSGLGGGQYQDFLQTDASINPGNSGGPLVNLDGEVIGINTMIAGIGTGIGFAVPSSMAKPVVAQLIATGRVRRPYLGIGMQDVTPALRTSLGQHAPEGALVDQVRPGSPSEKAGVKVGDIVTGIDGTKVDSSRTLQAQVLGKKIGDRVKLEVWRDGKTLTLEMVTKELPAENEAAGEEGEGEEEGGGAQPPSHEESAAPSELGIKLETLTPSLAERLGVGRQTKGAIVTEIAEGGLAAEAGLRPGDVVLEIDRKQISSAGEAGKLLAKPRPAGHLLRIQRGDTARYLSLGAKD